MRGSVLTIEPSLGPSLEMTRQLGLREGTVLPLLDGDSSKLYAASVLEFCLMVDIQKLLGETDCWLHLKVNFKEDLELTQVGDGIGGHVLGSKVEKMKHGPDFFEPGGRKPLCK